MEKTTGSTSSFSNIIWDVVKLPVTILNWCGKRLVTLCTNVYNFLISNPFTENPVPKKTINQRTVGIQCMVGLPESGKEVDISANAGSKPAQPPASIPGTASLEQPKQSPPPPPPPPPLPSQFSKPPSPTLQDLSGSKPPPQKQNKTLKPEQGQFGPKVSKDLLISARAGLKSMDNRDETNPGLVTPGAYPPPPPPPPIPQDLSGAKLTPQKQNKTLEPEQARSGLNLSKDILENARAGLKHSDNRDETNPGLITPATYIDELNSTVNSGVARGRLKKVNESKLVEFDELQELSNKFANFTVHAETVFQSKENLKQALHETFNKIFDSQEGPAQGVKVIDLINNINHCWGLNKLNMNIRWFDDQNQRAERWHDAMSLNDFAEDVNELKGQIDNNPNYDRQFLTGIKQRKGNLIDFKNLTATANRNDPDLQKNLKGWFDSIKNFLNSQIEIKGAQSGDITTVTVQDGLTYLMARGYQATEFGVFLDEMDKLEEKFNQAQHSANS